MDQNKELYLRALEPEDLDLLYQVENDPSIWWIGGQKGPFSKFMLRHYLANTTGDIYTDRQLRLVAAMKHNHIPVGIVDLTEFSPTHHRAEVGILVLPDFRGQGLSSDMLQLLEEYANEHLFLHQLYAYTPVCHDSSVALFRRAGYQEEHLLKDWICLKEGFCDAFLFQKILKR